jgi:DNA-binding MarR family transcriptional regulator
MESLGYIRRQRRPDNRKNIYVYLTDEGRALRDLLVPLAQEINDMAVEGVSEEDLAATRRVLNAMISSLLRFESRIVTEKRRVAVPGDPSKTIG